jgi:hypothetical protein
MDQSTARRLLQGRHSTRTQWEFVNFVLEEQGSHMPRQVLAQLTRYRDISDQLDVIPADTGMNLTLREDLIAERKQIEAWLEQCTEQELAEHLAGLEAGEAEYWPEHLGRQAAVDLLSIGHVSKEVIARAVLLSEDDYRKFATVCGNISHVINSVSREIDHQMGYGSLPEGQPR